MRVLGAELPGVVVHASAPTEELSRVVLWHGGTPHTGAVLEPVRAAAASVGRHVVSVARPGYGGASRLQGRSVADGVRDVVEVAERLGLEDVVMVGYSGGGPHAIAAAVALGSRVSAVLTMASIAPFDGRAEWFDGMADPSALRAALRGADARSAHPEGFDADSFVGRDWAALEQRWRALGADAGAAHGHGPAGEVDDDLAFVRPWGFPLQGCGIGARIVHGTADRVVPVGHARALAAALPAAELHLHADDGHVSVLEQLAHHLSAIA